MSAAMLSTTAQHSLRGARRWARVAAVMTLVPCLPMGVLLPWMLVLTRADALPKFLGLALTLAIVNPMAILALVHASRLRRFARGDRSAAAGAFRVLRVLWIAGTAAYAVQLIHEIATF